LLVVVAVVEVLSLLALPVVEVPAVS